MVELNPIPRGLKKIENKRKGSYYFTAFRMALPSSTPLSFLRVRCRSNTMFMLAYDPTADTCLSLKQMLVPLLAVADTRRIVLFSFRPDAVETQQHLDVWPDDRKLQEHSVPKCSLVFLKVLDVDLQEEEGAFPMDVLRGARLLV